ncbi:MAG: HAMP domain-containing sensor histidine kinase [Coriobacteriaceae bacterium]|nr:HAMP domain-containing sensor histidine kinase [Coriobacteriaceae bacterium]
MLLRNKEVRRTFAAAVICTIAGAAFAFAAARVAVGTVALNAYTSTPETALKAAGNAAAGAAAFGALAVGALVSGVFMLATRMRYRALATMAAKLDRVLAGERAVSFHAMNEGELAILASELDKVIARLHLAVDELQAEKLALSDALADISHQIKTPLTSIAITTELVRDRLARQGCEGDTLARIELIQRLQGRVEDLVSALLKLARIDAGVIKLTRVPVDAGELVRKSFESLAVAFDIADVTFTASVQRGASFEGDPAWSAEALENILKNCMEHTPASGHVRVSATEDALACRIRIEDTGPGIAEADLPHIFERFYRGEGDRRAASEVNPTGVGIGLALAHSLVTAQGGKLTAENVRDEQGHVTGAAFTLTFFKAAI